jgi:hypothetical protein
MGFSFNSSPLPIHWKSRGKHIKQRNELGFTKKKYNHHSTANSFFPHLFQCSLPVMHLLKTFLPKYTFFPIITRSFHPPKPDPAGILHIAAEWGLDDGGEGLIMVGSFLLSGFLPSWSFSFKKFFMIRCGWSFSVDFICNSHSPLNT